MLRFSTLLLLSLLVSCSRSEPTIDATSEESLKKSLAVLTEGMTEEQKEQIGKAMLAHMFQDGLLCFDKDKAREKLHGLTATELLQRQQELQKKQQAAAEKLRVERQRRQEEREAEAEKLRAELRVRQQEEVAELETKRAASRVAATALERFRVTKSRFYFPESRFSRNAVIELHVRNDTEFPVSRAYFGAKLQSPGRSVPWVDSSFNYSIPGGLEPGEETTWKLSPNMFGEWSRAPRDRDDMVLTVTATRIDGADGAPLFDARQFTEVDEKRLAELRQQLAVTPAAPR